ncbi:MAG TPA: HU family DNA-binding protein [Gammaproteobacteria bacterium]|nr:HU family DNA-binding protein [Gammaproteobacteria bacterium]
MATKKSAKSAKSAKSSKKASKKSSGQANDFSLRLKANPDKETKSQILAKIAGQTGLHKKEVHRVFQVLANEIAGHMIKRGSGEFTIPETGIRVKRKTRPATKKRLGRNPATGEQIWIAAKPARTVVKIVPLRVLKESVTL